MSEMVERHFADPFFVAENPPVAVAATSMLKLKYSPVPRDGNLVETYFADLSLVVVLVLWFWMLCMNVLMVSVVHIHIPGRKNMVVR